VALQRLQEEVLMPLSQGWGKSLSVAVLALVAVMVTYIPPMVRAARAREV
jgi:hypothetical protein